MSENKRLSIRADQWAEVAADVEAGRCKAYCEEDEIVNIVDEPIHGWKITACYRTSPNATIDLEWLTPPDIEAELQAMAEDPDIQREYAAIQAEEYGIDNQRQTLADKWSGVPGQTAGLWRRLLAAEAEVERLRAALKQTRILADCYEDFYLEQVDTADVENESRFTAAVNAIEALVAIGETLGTQEDKTNDNR